ncbi:MAG: hypothetical protein KF801_10020 [Cryobacterium sp.]|nr:hypothetical protein [Cryobacterium sp.]
MKSPPDLPTTLARTERRKPLGPWHEFWLLEEQEDYRAFLDRRDAPVRLSDDLRSYVHDSIRWLQFSHPGSKRASLRGLDVHGLSIIKDPDEGARLNRIFSAWAELFEQAPPEMELRGGVGMETYQGTERFVIEILLVDRDALVRDLRTLARGSGRASPRGNTTCFTSVSETERSSLDAVDPG